MPAIEPLITALADNNWRVRKKAEEALRQIGWRPAKDEAEARYWIAKREWEMCVAIGVPAIEPLITALADNDSAVRAGAAEALKQIGWRPAKDEAGARYWIAKRKWEKCVEIGVPAIEPLITALADNNWRVRAGVAEALGQIGWRPAKDEAGARYWIAKWKWEKCVEIGVPAIEPLITALADSDWFICWAAARVLVEIYKTGRLDGSNKRRILEMKTRITLLPHHDERPGDCHSDSGIGVSFPV